MRYLLVALQVLLLFNLAFAGPASGADTKTADKGSAAKSVESRDLPPLDRFEVDIRNFEAKDKLKPSKPGCTVFVGSSTFTKWTRIEDEFAEFKAINRGFGGSTFRDINHYIDRLVTKHKPAKVVVYAGTNDIAELHHSGKDVFADFQDFAKAVHAALPQTEIYFISMSVAPCRVQFSKDYDSGNALIRKYAESTPHLHYIDVIPVMRSAKGELRAELFGPDRLHMDNTGYALWIPVIQKALRS